MLLKAHPEVIHTFPSNYSVDIDSSTLKSIKIGFNADMDFNSLEGNILIYNESEHFLQTKIEYANRIATIVLLEPLEEGQTYRVVVKGDSEAYVKGEEQGEGVIAVTGAYMTKDYECSFSTSAVTVPVPKILSPSHYSSIDIQPYFQWTAIKDGEEYELEVSALNTFRPLSIPESGTKGILLSETSFKWKEDLKDGTYYVRVRAKVDGKWSAWSHEVQFNIDTVKEGTISASDTLPPEMDDDYESTIEIVDIYPQEDASQVPPNLPGIAVRVLGKVMPENVSIEVYGSPIDNEYEDGSYEQLMGEMSIQENPDGTSWILFNVNGEVILLIED